MRSRKLEIPRRALSAWLSALMLVLSVALPVYERADLGVVHAVESRHDPGRCPHAHDHSICTQARANHFSTPSHAPGARSPSVLAWAPPTAPPIPGRAVSPRASRARAPPDA